MSQLQQLAQREPWRQNHGQPKNALDPTWEGVDRDFCGGAIEHEVTSAGATGWWHCSNCGYVGCGQHTAHRVVQHPLDYFVHSTLFYIRRRTLQGAPLKQASMQGFFVAGAALRYAATMPPEKVGEYVRAGLMKS